MELICTNGKYDSGTKFTSPEFCLPFIQNGLPVNQYYIGGCGVGKTVNLSNPSKHFKIACDTIFHCIIRSQLKVITSCIFAQVNEIPPQKKGSFGVRYTTTKESD